MIEIIGLAGVLAILLGAVHSVLGERLIFSRLRRSSLVPNMEIAPLKPRHLSIIWASWHIVSLLGAGLGVLLITQGAYWLQLSIFARAAIILSMTVSCLLVLYATRGRHPGWLVLLLIALLLFLAEFVGSASFGG